MERAVSLVGVKGEVRPGLDGSGREDGSAPRAVGSEGLSSA